MKKFWLPTLQLAASSLLASAALGGWHLITEEVKFHREVRADIAAMSADISAVKQKLGIPTNESETHVAANP